MLPRSLSSSSTDGSIVSPRRGTTPVPPAAAAAPVSPRRGSAPGVPVRIRDEPRGRRDKRDSPTESPSGSQISVLGEWKKTTSLTAQDMLAIANASTPPPPPSGQRAPLPEERLLMASQEIIPGTAPRAKSPISIAAQDRSPRPGIGTQESAAVPGLILPRKSTLLQAVQHSDTLQQQMADPEEAQDPEMLAMRVDIDVSLYKLRHEQNLRASEIGTICHDPSALQTPRYLKTFMDQQQQQQQQKPAPPPPNPPTGSMPAGVAFDVDTGTTVRISPVAASLLLESPRKEPEPEEDEPVTVSNLVHAAREEISAIFKQSSLKSSDKDAQEISRKQGYEALARYASTIEILTIEQDITAMALLCAPNVCELGWRCWSSVAHACNETAPAPMERSPRTSNADSTTVVWNSEEELPTRAFRSMTQKLTDSRRQYQHKLPIQSTSKAHQTSWVVSLAFFQVCRKGKFPTSSATLLRVAISWARHKKLLQIDVELHTGLFIMAALYSGMTQLDQLKATTDYSEPGHVDLFVDSESQPFIDLLGSTMRASQPLHAPTSPPTRQLSPPPTRPPPAPTRSNIIDTAPRSIALQEPPSNPLVETEKISFKDALAFFSKVPPPEAPSSAGTSTASSPRTASSSRTGSSTISQGGGSATLLRVPGKR